MRMAEANTSSDQALVMQKRAELSFEARWAHAHFQNLRFTSEMASRESPSYLTTQWLWDRRGKLNFLLCLSSVEQLFCSRWPNLRLQYILVWQYPHPFLLKQMLSEQIYALGQKVKQSTDFVAILQDDSSSIPVPAPLGITADWAFKHQRYHSLKILRFHTCPFIS